MTKQTDHDAHQALSANIGNGWGYIGSSLPSAADHAANSESIRHADLIDPPLTVADGWKAIAVVFFMWAGVFVAAPFMFGVGQTLAQIYFY